MEEHPKWAECRDICVLYKCSPKKCSPAEEELINQMSKTILLWTSISLFS